MHSKVWVLVFLTIAFLVRFASATGVVAISFGSQICDSNNTCSGVLSAEIHVDPDNRDFSLEISNYKNNAGEIVELNEPVSITISRYNTTMLLPIRRWKTFYSAYEHFEYDESCSAGVEFGGCFDEATKPPADVQGSERFVLCCVDAIRGWGLHCLRYNYTARYEAYRTLVPQYIQRSLVRIQRGNKEPMIFNMSSITSLQHIADEAKVIYNARIQLEGSPRESVIVVKDSRPPNMLSIAADLFFVIPYSSHGFSKLGVDALTYKLDAKCNTPLHDLTATHSNDSHIRDQFWEYRENGAREYFGMASAVDSAGSNGDVNDVVLNFVYNDRGTSQYLIEIENVQ